MKTLILVLSGILMSASAFADSSYHYCERTSLNTSGFSSSRAAESWYPKVVSMYVDVDSERAKLRGQKAKVELRADNKRVTITMKRPNKSGTYTYKIIMLANGEVHADLRTPGGFRSAGGAIYKCSNWDGNYSNTSIN